MKDKTLHLAICVSEFGCSTGKLKMYSLVYFMNRTKPYGLEMFIEFLLVLNIYRGSRV